ncbi:MAG: septum formation initiator family protein [Clostridia bacterium]|nr:septum formation initiator family protein [Clostridia bacterium]
MYGRSPEEPSRLAAKLRQEYRNRGENLRGIGAASTEELMHRAQMGRDPRENVSEEAFSDRLRNRNFTYDGMQQNIHSTQTGYYGGAQNRTYRNAQNTGTSRSRTAEHRQGTGRYAGSTGSRLQQEQPSGEVQVKGRGLPVGYLIMLAVVTMMIMTILFSISQIYQTTNTIDDLEKELTSLQTVAAELELAIEEKNDIRVIEQIATDQLGMVGEDSVQRKYISLSDGERIDIIGEDENAAAEGTFGTMLSSIAAAFAGFFENLGK